MYRDFLDVPEWLHGQDEDTSSPRSSYSVESDSGGSAESAASSCPSELEDIRPDPTATGAWKWLTISTIRHAQSVENVGHSTSLTDATNATDPLTDLGVHQATVLAKQWTNVRISCIYTSPYTRAVDSALTLLRHHHTSIDPSPYAHSHAHGSQFIDSRRQRRPSVQIHPQLIERKSGTHALSFLACGDVRGYRAARDGHCDAFPTGNRDWVPEGGGESRNMVNARAEVVLVDLLRSWAVEDESIPVGVLRCRGEGDDGGGIGGMHPEDGLLEGVPHVVVVSHNIFLRALDETIRRCTWGPARIGKVSYPNSGWGRYLIRYRESEGGIELIARPLTVPMSR